MNRANIATVFFYCFTVGEAPTLWKILLKSNKHCICSSYIFINKFAFKYTSTTEGIQVCVFSYGTLQKWWSMKILRNV